ncbi:hypothetical protein LTR53_016073 [Teratosphaeriaceae sp. CCFEE 6253]|nr:hypothetical protein LTR53_016073 [Teratosphaeriaceae sp. CCFEE 6253]
MPAHQGHSQQLPQLTGCCWNWSRTLRAQGSRPSVRIVWSEELPRITHQYAEQESTLAQVKVHGRDIKTAGPIFTEKGIKVLSQYGLDDETPDVSREALRCLANAFLLNEPCRQTFVDLGYAPKASERLKLDNSDDEFLVARILFLLTYNTRVDFEQLVEQNALADSVNQHVARHARAFSAGVGLTQVPLIEQAAMGEILKLIFNVTYYHPGLTRHFSPAVQPIASLLVHHPLPSPLLQPPVTHMVNALLNLDLQTADGKVLVGGDAKSNPKCPQPKSEQIVDRLIFVFDTALNDIPEHDLDQAAAPLCTLLRRVHELADAHMKSRMRGMLLPRQEDRDRPLGQGESLPSRLLRSSCSAGLPTLRENIANLLFELSNKDANVLVKNIGYGFASGFLMSHNIAIPSTVPEPGSVASQGASNDETDINPVTGQRLSAERLSPSDSPIMSEGEKEREAERLFVLFERLRATGVVDVENPVQQAVDEGRFEELPE